MEAQFNWANRDVTESNTMIISQHNMPNLSKLSEKLWGKVYSEDQFNNVPSSFGAIRQLDLYGGPVVDKYVKAEGEVQGMINTGWPDMETKINRFAYDAHKGKPIINYSYKPKYGVIKAKPRTLQCNRFDNNQLAYRVKGSNFNRVMAQDNIRRALATTGSQVGQKIAISQTTIAASDSFLKPEKQSYNCLIEGYFARLQMSELGQEVKIQPQLHIGILPVQANSPGASVGFVCAAAYWQIDTVIKIKVNFGNAFNHTVARPIDWMESYYSDARDDTLAMHGSLAGGIPAAVPYA